MKKNDFAKWIDTFVSEKSIDTEATFVLDENVGLKNFHVISVDAIVEFIKRKPKRVTDTVKSNFVAIDYNNGDAMDFFRYMAMGMALEYEYEDD